MYTLNPSNSDFFNSSKLLSEFIRQASVCHGCRLCFNYCDAFPTLFKYTDEKGVKKLELNDLFEVASKCFHCKMCFVNCPYTPPHEFNMDFASLMEWAWLYYKTTRGMDVRERLFEMLDMMRFARPLAKKVMEGRELLGIHKDAPLLPVAEKGFSQLAKPKKLEKPVAKVALFTTCLVENFFPEIGLDLLEVYESLGIEVKLVNDFVCCGAPMLDVGDADRLKKNAEHNVKVIERLKAEGYEVISPIPTCTLMINEYHKVLDRETPKVLDAMEFLLRLKKEGKITLPSTQSKNVYYHPPCHLRYLKVGYPGVNLLRTSGFKVEISNKGCSGIDGGWGLRNYDVARRVGSKMMESFKESKAELFVTECPLAGLQIEKASGRKPLHPIQVLKEVIKSGQNKS
ncbi:MAG: heterodisulfide reductase-related iron-sulfur binding cluster [Sulfolobaceae archaeon]|nr:heterodisulfide reductase-related iron-sulfur binding cluster [Sulfolobaceae archaeon]